MTPPAVLGIGVIIAGIFLVSWWGRFRQIVARPSILFRDAGVGYAVLTGMTITLYSLVDKQGVAHVQPFLYMYLLTLGSAIGISPYVLYRCRLAEVKLEWKSDAWSIRRRGPAGLSRLRSRADGPVTLPAQLCRPGSGGWHCHRRTHGRVRSR